MDLSYINKLANFKRACTEADELKNKIAKENEDIIQLRVDQSTAYFKLNEKYKQLEFNYQNLQQNMLGVQMENEKLSEDYMKEKRRRHDIFNKVTSTREMCDVLVKYTSKLEETLIRCKADQVVLCDAYNKANEVVKDVKIKHKQAIEKQLNEINNLGEKVALLNESRSQMMQYYEESKLEAQARFSQLEAKLKHVKQQNEGLHKDNAGLNSKLHANTTVIEQKEKMISSLEQDMQRLIQEVDRHRIDMDATMQQQINLNNHLEKKLAEQQEFMKKLRKENEEQRATISQFNVDIESLKQDLIKYEELVENQRKEGEVLQELQQAFKQQGELVEEKSKEIEEIMKQVSQLKLENNMKDEKINEIINECDVYKKAVGEKEEDIKTANTEISRLNGLIKGNDVKISELMGNWKRAKDEACNLNITLTDQAQMLSEEKNKFYDLELKHNVYVEHSKQFASECNKATEMYKNTISKITKEKETLEDRVNELEKKLDDMRLENEVTSMKATKSKAMEDDKAVMECPQTTDSQMYVALRPKKNFPPAFSDSSEDTTNINLSDINHIFVGKCKDNFKPMLSKRKLHPLPNKPTQGLIYDDDVTKAKTKIFKTKQVYSRKP